MLQQGVDDLINGVYVDTDLIQADAQHGLPVGMKDLADPAKPIPTSVKTITLPETFLTALEDDLAGMQATLTTIRDHLSKENV